MQTANYTINARQGSTFQWVWKITSDSNISPTNLDGHWDLSGYSARMQVRKSTKTSSTLLNLTSPSVSGTGIDLTSTGYVTVNVPASTMASLPDGKWDYDFELVETSTGIVSSPLAGKFVISAEVTR